MNFHALTYYCEQCEDHSLGGSCFLHPSQEEGEPAGDWETKLLEAWKENRPDDIVKIVRQLLVEKEEKAYEEGVSEGMKEGYRKGSNDRFSQSKSEMIKTIREWQNYKRKWAESMPALFGNQITGYQSALSDLIDFVNELEK